VIRRQFPQQAPNAARVLIRIGNLALVLLAGAFLLALSPKIIANAEIWRILGSVLIAIAAVLSGHYLAGPELKNRVSIANANVQRNPGLALAIAAWNLPDKKTETILEVITYSLIGLMIAAVYTKVIDRTISNRSD
jgi:BASS family bile acid:Na+ symporter